MKGKIITKLPFNQWQTTHRRETQTHFFAPVTWPWPDDRDIQTWPMIHQSTCISRLNRLEIYLSS